MSTKIPVTTTTQVGPMRSTREIVAKYVELAGWSHEEALDYVCQWLDDDQSTRPTLEAFLERRADISIDEAGLASCLYD